MRRAVLALDRTIRLAIDQSGQHAGNLFQVGLELRMLLASQQTLSCGQFQQRYAFLNASAGDAEKVTAIGFRETAVAFGDVSGDLESSAIQLVDQEVIAAREIASECAGRIRKADCFLVDNQLLEGEGHRVSAR